MGSRKKLAKKSVERKGSGTSSLALKTPWQLLGRELCSAAALLISFGLGWNAVIFSGCGGAIPASQKAAKKETVEMEELRITARREQDGRFSFQVYDASELFTRATDAAKNGRCDEAAELYQKMAAEFSQNAYVSVSLYNTGLCLQNQSKFSEAAQYYRRIGDTVPGEPEAKDAHFQLITVLLRQSDWSAALEAAEKVLQRNDLSAADRLEGLAQRATALVELGRYEEAAAEARAALDLFRNQPADQPIRDPYYAAAANYVIAETFRRRAAALEFPSADTEAQRQVLLRRAELVLEAQREYFKSIQFQNAHWAAAAGFQIGQMYDELWRAITDAPVPTSLSPEARDAYRGELAKLIEPLTRHAIRYWELTLMMIERTGVSSEWTERTKQELEKVRERLLVQPVQEKSDEPAPAQEQSPSIDDKSPAPSSKPETPAPAN
jgi:tetratricopeptide (TPR) repeat protein